MASTRAVFILFFCLIPAIGLAKKRTPQKAVPKASAPPTLPALPANINIRENEIAQIFSFDDETTRHEYIISKEIFSIRNEAELFCIMNYTVLAPTSDRVVLLLNAIAAGQLQNDFLEKQLVFDIEGDERQKTFLYWADLKAAPSRILDAISANSRIDASFYGTGSLIDLNSERQTKNLPAIQLPAICVRETDRSQSTPEPTIPEPTIEAAEPLITELPPEIPTP